MDTKIFPVIYYQSVQRYLVIPSWARFFITLGFHIARFESLETNLVLSISVPSLSYVAPLVSLGFIVARSQLVSQDYSQDVEILKNLPEGTPVFLRSKDNRKYSGVLLGYRSFCGDDYFVVQTDQKNATQRHVKFQDAGNIQIRETESSSLPSSQKGREMPKAKPLLGSILGSEIAPTFVGFSRLEVLFVGEKRKLQEEVTTQKFACKDKKAGVLQDILRVKQFQGKSHAYRSFILSNRAKQRRVQSVVGDPPLVIFDGSSGYLKWNHQWNNSNKVIILSRTDTHYEPAIEQLIGNYIKRSSGNNIPKIPIGEIPAGIEAMMFEEDK